MPLQIFNTTKRSIPEALLMRAVADVLEQEGCTNSSIDAIFCGNRMIRRINREFLQHDYPTDTITFRYKHGPDIEGEFYISLDVINENSDRFNAAFEDELLRVTIHSTLHLVGYDDKTPDGQEAMTGKEDYYLRRLRES
jgi:rRNA maturation RNase YbeY